MDAVQRNNLGERRHAATVLLREPKKEPSIKTKMNVTGLWHQRMVEEKKSIFFKITFIGPSNAGKTSIIRQYIDNAFEDDYVMTSGMQNYTKMVEKKEKHIKMTVWDTPNYSKFQPTIYHNCENSDALIFVYGHSNPQMIDEAREIMSEVAEKFKDKGKIMVALLNPKAKKKRSTDTGALKELLDKYSIKPLKANAISRESVRAFFDQVLDLLLEQLEKTNANLQENNCEDREYIETIKEDNEDCEAKIEDGVGDEAVSDEEVEGLNDDLQEADKTLEMIYSKKPSKKQRMAVANPVPDFDLHKEKGIVMMKTNHYIGAYKEKKGRKNALGCYSSSSMCKIF